MKSNATTEGQDKVIVDMCYNEYKKGTLYNYNYLNIRIDMELI